MKKILYLTFYFEPDLCAGSFRNTSLAKELAKQLGENGTIDLLTTVPNRYKTYKMTAPNFEKKGNLHIHRVNIPKHRSGFLDQIISYIVYYKEVMRIVNKEKYDLVFVSTGRLFSSYLGRNIAKRLEKPLYLDVRDIFVDTMEEVLKNPVIKFFLFPCIKLVEKKTFNYAYHINLISEGFKCYFQQFKCNSFSFYPNGIDNEFLDNLHSNGMSNIPRTIVYAGNIGEGQGLEKIIPLAAKQLGEDYKFIIVGDGGTKQKLKAEIEKRNVSNVELKNPIGRNELINLYNDCDFLFLHLNNYKAFEKVLPSKLFEYGASDKPIIAGVSGFAAEFIENNIPNVLLFPPCDSKKMVKLIQNYTYKREKRISFIEKFKRDRINKEMAKSILE